MAPITPVKMTNCTDAIPQKQAKKKKKENRTGEFPTGTSLIISLWRVLHPSVTSGHLNYTVGNY